MSITCPCSAAALPGRLLATLLLSISATQATGTERLAPLEPTDIFALSTANDPQISPDGKQIVYVQVRADIVQDEFQPSLWIVDADGRNQHPLTEAGETAVNPRWSPDGTRIAFIATRNGARQIVVRWMSSGIETLIGGLAAPPGNLEWSPDGRLLAFSMLESAPARKIGSLPQQPPGASWKPGPSVIDRALYRADGAGYLPTGQEHLFVVPAGGGVVTRVTATDSGSLPLIGRPYAWDEDSSALIAALVHQSETAILHGHMFDSGLYRLPVDGSPARKLIDRDGPEASPAVSPDGRFIAYVGHDEQQQSYTVGQLFLLDRRSGERRALTGSLDRDVLSPRWSSDGKGIYAFFADHGVNKLALFDLNGGHRLITEQMGMAFTAYTAEPSYSVSRNGRIALQWANTTVSGEIAIIDRTGSAPRRLTQLNEPVLGSRTLGTLQEVRAVSSYDRLPIQGWLIQPPQFEPGRLYPLILEIHGGPDAAYGPYFDIEKQLMAAAGYLVLYVNPRGSTSYGHAFGNLLQDDFPGHEVEDLLSAVDAVIQGGHVDPKRLYVTGGSGGGTLTAWLTCHTNRFRAAGVLYPVIEWQSQALTSDILPLVFHGFFHGTPWSQPDQYRAHSLLTDVGKVHTPTLVMTGESDFRTPISQSEQYFAALRYHGVESVFVRVPLESHGLRVYPSHFAQKVPLITGWFDEHR